MNLAYLKKMILFSKNMVIPHGNYCLATTVEHNWGLKAGGGCRGGKRQEASFRLSGRANRSQQIGLENGNFLLCLNSRRNWYI